MDWLLTDEEIYPIIQDTINSGYTSERYEEVAEAQAKKFYAWLNSPCGEHGHIRCLRKDCRDCMEKMDKELGVDNEYLMKEVK